MDYPWGVNIYPIKWMKNQRREVRNKSNVFTDMPIFAGVILI